MSGDREKADSLLAQAWIHCARLVNHTAARPRCIDDGDAPLPACIGCMFHRTLISWILLRNALFQGLVTSTSVSLTCGQTLPQAP